MKVAFFGTGLLGYPMAERVLKGGHALTVYNRTASKAAPLVQKGAKFAASAAAAVVDAKVVILMLADAPAIQEVLFSGEPLNLTGKTVIQMGTIAPSESIAFSQKVKQCKGDYFECPVLGSRSEAINARLILMAGARPDQFAEWKNFLAVFGPQPRLIGEIGRAAALKLALNQLIAVEAAGFSLSLGMVQKNGIDVAVFMDILKGSALFAPMFAKKLPHWLNNDYADANFPVKHLLKDVNLILDDARAKGLKTDVAEAIKGLLVAAQERGFSEEDYAAVFKVVNNP